MRGTRNAVDVEYVRKTRGLSALGVLTIDGMIDCAIRSSNGVNTAEFLGDFDTAVLPHLQAYPLPRSIVVLDNAIVHHHCALIAAVKAAGAHIFFLPAYSYDMMPIESAISKVKSLLQRDTDGLCARNPRAALHRAMMMVSGSDAESYFRRTGWPVEEDPLAFLADG